MRTFYRGFAIVVLVLASSTQPTRSQLSTQSFPDLKQRIVFAANDSKACLRCHGLVNFAFRDSATGPIRNLSVSAERYSASIHKNLTCRQCHENVTEYPHRFAGERKRVSCGDNCHATDREGKAYTHASVQAEFAASVHGTGLTGKNKDAPSCLTCHGNGNPHDIAKAAKSVSVKDKMQLCTSCHDDAAKMIRNKVTTEAVSSYQRSFHFKAIRFGETGTAVCQDCHTVHSVLPKDSARSSIAPVNVAKTCGRSGCHPGAKINFAMSGANHLGMRIEREPLLSFLEYFFIVLTLGTMVMLVVGIILDIQKKFGWLAILANAGRHTVHVLRGMSGGSRTAMRLARKILID